MSDIESAKRKAAYAAVDEFVKSGMRLGVGSGSTVVFAVERLKALTSQGKLKDRCATKRFIVRVPKTIIDASQYGLKTSVPNDTPELDVAIDGADEVDLKLNCIKGGGACQLQEKVVASCAKIFVVVADYRKESKTLGEKWKKGVPIEVVPMAYRLLMTRCSKMGGKPVLRMAQNKAGPVVSDNGNFVVDCDFGKIDDPSTLETKLKMIPGVVEVGLFVGMAVKAFFGQEDGSVTTRIAAA